MCPIVGHVGKPLIWGVDGRPLEYAARAGRAGVRRGALRGVPGDIGYGGLLQDPAEYESTWKALDRRVVRVEEMLRRNGIVRGAVRLRTLPILSADWQWSPPAEDPTDAEIAAAERAQTRWVKRGRTPWRKLLGWLSTGLWYGFAVVEGEFGVDGDGYIMPMRWEFRSPHSIGLASMPWTFDAAGNLTGISQYAASGLGQRRPQQMEADNCLVYTHAEAANIEGESELRACHRAEFLSHNAMIGWGIAIQRFGSPTPVGELAEGQGAKERDEMLSALQAFQAGEDTALVVGAGQKLTPFGAGDGQKISADGFLRVQTEEIATALSVPFMVLGQAGSGGTQALGTTQFDGYTEVLLGDASEMAATVYEFESRLCAQDNGPDVRPPTLAAGNIRRRAGEEILRAYDAIRANGGRVSEADEALVRERFGLPPPAPIEVSDEETASTILNGAQITAIVDIAGRVRAGEITAAQGTEIIARGFPISRDAAQIIAGESGPSGGSGPAGGGAGETAGPAAASDAALPDADISDDAADDAVPDSGAALDDETKEIEQRAHAGCSHELGAAADAAKAAMGLREFRRPLRGAERYVDFAALDGRMNDGVGEIIDATETLREQAVASLVEQARAVVGAGAIKDVKGILVPAALRKAVQQAALGVLRQIRAAGAQAVRREMNRQAVALTDASMLGALELMDHTLRLRYCDALVSARVVELVDESAAPSDAANANPLQQEQARRLAERLLSPLEERAQDQATRMLGGGGTVAGAPESAFEALAKSMLDRSLKDVARAAGYAVPAALNLGRDGAIRAVVAANDDDAREVVAHYVTLLDRNVCGPCSRAEDVSHARSGFVVGADEYNALVPPLQPNDVTGDGCEGEGQCRCTMVYEMSATRQALPRFAA